MSTFADVGMADRMKAKQQLDTLRALARELDPVDVLLAVRDELAPRTKDPRERAILARYLEDAAARIIASVDGRL